MTAQKGGEEAYEMQEVAWGLLEALMWEDDFNRDDDLISLEHALRSDMDGAAFGAGQSTSYPLEDMDIPNFPPLSEAMLRDDAEPIRTSEPISIGVDTAKEGELNSLIDKRMFMDLLSSPMGFKRFQEWVNEEGLHGSAKFLRLYQDIKGYSQMVDDLTAVGRGIRSLYMDARAAEGRRLLPAASDTPLTHPSPAMAAIENAVIDRLYTDEFKRFIAGEISQGAKGPLGKSVEADGRGDLAEVFCIADPRQHDQPLVLVSDAFCKLSEYPRSQLVGRNCRFLQGPQTDREAVSLLREAIEAGREHRTLLLNYTRTGKPFWNLLNMIPVKNAEGEVELLIGAQVNISKALENSSLMHRLAGSENQSSDFTGFSAELLSTVGKSSAKADRLKNYSTDGGAAPSIADNSSAKSINESVSEKLSKMDSPATRRSLAERPDIDSNTSHISPSVPDMVREQMVAFSSAYSRSLLFNVKDRQIIFFSPALLVFLGYPIRGNKDRWASSVIGRDILDLIAAEKQEEAESAKNTIRQVIESTSSHSLFTGLQRAPRSPRIDAPGTVSVARCLLHFTPLRNGENVAEKYAVVVG